MTLRLALRPDIQASLKAALLRGGTDEIGGVMMAEHVGDVLFRVIEVTVQHGGGSFARFVRVVRDFVDPLKQFFKRTLYNYRKYNYIGEWHSHPSFALKPSMTDCETMQSLAEDSSVGANFVVLLLVKLGSAGQLNAAGFVFRAHLLPAQCEVVFE